MTYIGHTAAGNRGCRGTVLKQQLPTEAPHRGPSGATGYLSNLDTTSPKYLGYKSFILFITSDTAPRASEKAETLRRSSLTHCLPVFPSRINFFGAFVKTIAAHAPPVRNVIEFGSGPGFLAEFIFLRQSSGIRSWTSLHTCSP